MKALSREEFLSALQQTEAKPVPVTVKGWGDGTVFVRATTVEEAEEEADRERDEKKSDDGAPTKKHRLARAAAKVLCDADGKRYLDPENPEHIMLLERQPWSRLQKVLAAADPDQD